jgi:hypothetical protein
MPVRADLDIHPTPTKTAHTTTSKLPCAKPYPIHAAVAGIKAALEHVACPVAVLVPQPIVRTARGTVLNRAPVGTGAGAGAPSVVLVPAVVATPHLSVLAQAVPPIVFTVGGVASQIAVLVPNPAGRARVRAVGNRPRQHHLLPWVAQSPRSCNHGPRARVGHRARRCETAPRAWE